MATIDKRAELALRKIELYEAEREQWEVEHRAAMVCFETENLLRFGILFYRDFSRLHVSDRLYERWYNTSVDVLREVNAIRPDFVARGFDVSLMEEFAACVRECEFKLAGRSSLHDELKAWEAASDEDFGTFESSLEK